MSTPLTVSLEAKLDQLEQDFAKAGELADKAVNDIEASFKNVNPGVGGDFLTKLLGGVAGIGVITGLISLISDAAKQMGDLANNAERAGIDIERFQALQYASNLTAKDFSTSISAVAKKLNDMTHDENDLSKFLDANNIKWKDAHGTVISIEQALKNAADLISRAATEQDKIKIAELFGLTKEWVAALEHGPGAFLEIANGAKEAGAVIDAELVQRHAAFEKEWQDSAKKWEDFFHSAIINITGWLETASEKVGLIAAQVREFAQEHAVFAASGARDWIDDLRDKLDDLIGRSHLVQDAVSATGTVIANLGDQATAAGSGLGTFVQYVIGLGSSSVATFQDLFALNKEIAATLDLVNKTYPAKSVVFPGKEDSDSTSAFDHTADQIRKRTAEYDAETESIGKNTEAKTRAKAVADLLAAAERDETKVTPELRREIDQLSDSLAKAAQKEAENAQAFRLQQQAIQFGGNQLIDVIDGIRTHSETAAQAMQNLLNAVIRAVEQALLLGSGPLAGIFGTAAAAGTGGTGGLLGGLFGGARAEGGPVDPGKTYLVGEQGPELVRFGQSGQVLPNSVIGSGQGGGITVSPVWNIDARGADPAAIARLEKAIIATNKSLESRAIAAMADHAMRSR